MEDIIDNEKICYDLGCGISLKYMRNDDDLIYKHDPKIH